MKRGEYARHRGVTAPAVSRYAREGRLVFSEDGLIDVAATDAVLDQTLRQVHGDDHRQSRAEGAREFMEAKTARERAMAAKATLEAELLAGRLVLSEEVAREAFTAARQAQEALLAIPDRLASLLAAESDPAKVHQQLGDELRRVVEAIAASTSDDAEDAQP